MKKCYYIKSNCLNSFYCFSYTTYDIQIKKKNLTAVFSLVFIDILFLIRLHVVDLPSQCYSLHSYRLYF